MFLLHPFKALVILNRNFCRFILRSYEEIRILQ